MHVDEIETVVRDGITYNDEADERELCVKLTRAVYFKLHKYTAEGMFDQQAITEVIASRRDDWKDYVVIVDVMKDDTWQIFVRRA